MQTVLLDECSHVRSLRATTAPTSRVFHDSGSPAGLAASALLLTRQAALAIYSGWLCVCPVPARASLGQQVTLEAWLPRWVCLTRGALHVWAPLAPSGSALRPLDAGLVQDAQSAGRMVLQLVQSLSLGWGSGAWAEGVQDAGAAAPLSGGQWHLWTPRGAWAFRAASEGEAAAWVLYVSAAVAGSRGVNPSGGASAVARPPPLLLGQGDVAGVAEAVASAGALGATGALAARMARLLSLWRTGGRWVAELLSCFSVRRRLRALGAASAPSATPLQQEQDAGQAEALLLTWEYLRALEVQCSSCSASSSDPGTAPLLPALLALAACACSRFLLDSSFAARLLALGIPEATLASAVLGQQGLPAQASSAQLWQAFHPLMLALESSIHTQLLAPFSLRQLQPCTGHGEERAARQARSAAALQTRLTAQSHSFSLPPSRPSPLSAASTTSSSFFSARMLLGGGGRGSCWG